MTTYNNTQTQIFKELQVTVETQEKLETPNIISWIFAQAERCMQRDTGQFALELQQALYFSEVSTSGFYTIKKPSTISTEPPVVCTIEVVRGTGKLKTLITVQKA